MQLFAIAQSCAASRARRIAAVVALAAVSAAASAQNQPQRFAGDIAALEPGAIALRVGAETVRLRLPDEARVTLRSKADWSAVTAGGYVGTTAVPQPDGTLLAKEVHVFTEAQRGTGEGHFPMSTPGDTMTNATVAAVTPPRARDTMTNATVAANAAAAGGHRLTLTYKGGEKTVVVPDGVPIITSEPGDRSVLAVGAHVVAYARRAPDGTLSVERISIGRNGFVTPL